MNIADDLKATFGGTWEPMSLPQFGFRGTVQEKNAEKMKAFFAKFNVPYADSPAKEGVHFQLPGTCVDLLDLASREYGFAASAAQTSGRGTGTVR